MLFVTPPNPDIRGIIILITSLSLNYLPEARKYKKTDLQTIKFQKSASMIWNVSFTQ